MAVDVRFFALMTATVALVSCSTDQPDFSAINDKAPLKILGHDKHLNPEVATAVHMLQQGNYKQASYMVNRQLQSDPTNSGLHIMNGLIYEKMAETDSDQATIDLAIVGYESALNVDPNNVLALTHLGKLNFRKKDYAKAQECFANALLVKPNDPALLQELAAASYYAYDLKTAQIAIKKAAADAPKDALAQRSAAMIYASLGDFNSASQYFEKYRSLIGEDSDVDMVAKRIEDWRMLYSSGRVHLAQQVIKKTSSDSSQSGGNTSDSKSKGGSSGGKGDKSSGSGSGSGSGKGDSSSDDSSDDSGDNSDDGSSDQPFAAFEDPSNTTPGTVTGDNSGLAAGLADEVLSQPRTGSGDGSGNDSSSATASTADSDEQVIIDCYLLRVVELTGTSKGNNILKNLEVTLSPGGYLFGTGKISGKGTQAFDPTTGNNITDNTVTTAADNNTIGTFSPNINLNNTGRMSFSIFAAALTWRGLSYNLNIANSANSRTEIVARPSLLTHLNKQSIFFSGDELVLGLGGGDAGASLLRYPVGVSLVITPTKIDGDNVTLDIAVEGANFNQPNAETNLQATVRVDKTRIDTSATVKMGQTIALGGLYEREELFAKDGFPGLDSVPVAQYFFSNEQTTSVRRSIIILMTPRTTASNQKAVREAMNQQRLGLSPTLQELQSRNHDWYKTEANLAKVFKYLEKDPVIYYAFQNGDILPPSWAEPKSYWDNVWDKVLAFLYY